MSDLEHTPSNALPPDPHEARLDAELSSIDRDPERIQPAQRPAAIFTPWVTYVLIAANLIVFGLEIAAGADPIKPTPQKMIELGGNFAPLTLHGEPWRMVSSMFLHYGLLHIALNMLCLAQGRVVERLFGRAGFISIYLVSGLLGGALSMARNANVVSAGASGAVFGVYGAFGAYLVFRKTEMAEEVWQKTTRQIGTFVGINLVYGLATPGIDMSAHIGGIAAGFVVGAALLAGKSADAQRIKRALGLTVAGVALSAAALFAIRAPTDVQPVLAAFEKVESSCIGNWNQIVEAGKTDAMTKEQMIAKVEKDVIAPWKAMRAQVFAVEHPPERLAALWAAIENYLVSRQDAWESYLGGLRAPEDQEAAKLEEYQRKEADVAKTAAAVKLEIDALSKK
jgi:rhomboid protease GluP